MNIIKYPCDESVNDAVSKDEPLLAVISFDGREAIVSHIDDAVEHHVLLANAGRKSTDTDKRNRPRKQIVAFGVCYNINVPVLR
mgnify:CR=1 FL=1